MFAALKEWIASLFKRDDTEPAQESGKIVARIGKILVAMLVVIALVIVVLGIYWSFEPDPFSVPEVMEQKLAARGISQVEGSASATTLIQVAETLLDKPGGYLSNDVMPPGVYLDNIPNWEFGVLVQVRDFSRALRESFSRSQSQSSEDLDLRESEPLFNFDNNSWMLPPTEREYQRAINRVYSYLDRISASPNPEAQFFARADNLATWLLTVESRLGSLSCRLSACVGGEDDRNEAADDQPGSQLNQPIQSVRAVTPWLQVDDVFYEARGTTWALLHFLRAIEIDFADVLADKNATASLEQIIRDLEFSQRTVFFPIILNGSGFGIFANHSLIMANYVSRANAAIIDLRSLLAQG